LLIAFLGFYQIGSMQYSLQWDMLDCYLPWRYFVSDCIYNKTLPFWSPYQNFGYPVFGDLRTVLNPEYNIIGLFGRYNISILHYSFVFFVSLSGFSMFLLAKYLKANKTFAICAGLGYMFSGFIVSEGQDIATISGSSFLVFAVYYYLKLIHSHKTVYIFKSSLALFLLVVNAYPGITIISIYFFITIFLFYLVKAINKRNYKQVNLLIRNQCILLGIVLSLCSFLIISYIQSHEYSVRLAGFTGEMLNRVPFTPQSLISFVFPYATVKEAWFNTICVMNNTYVGIITLIIVCLTFFRKISKLEIIFLVFAVISLWAAMGTTYKMRLWLSHLPLMNMFVTPAFFRAFVVFPIILVVSLTASSLINIDNFERIYKKAALLILIPISIIVIIAGTKGILTHEISLSIITENLLSQQHVGYKLHVFIQGIISASIIIFSILIFKKPFTNYKKAGLIVIVLFDMAASAQLNMHYTVVNDLSPSVIKKGILNAPKTFPVPELKPISEFPRNHYANNTLWLNVNFFSKEPAYNGFNSYSLALYDSIKNQYTQVFDSLLTNPIVYFSENFKDENTIEKNKAYISSTIFLKSDDYSFLLKEKFSKHDSDSLYISLFKPGEIRIVSNTHTTRFISVLQTYMPNWKLYIDGKPAPTYKTNINFIGFTTQAGLHEYKLLFENKLLTASFFATYIALFVLICLVLFLNIKENKKAYFSYIIASCLLLFLVFLFLYIKKPNIEEQQRTSIKKVHTLLQEKKEKTLLILNTSRSQVLSKEFENLNDLKVFMIRIEKYTDLKQLYHFLEKYNVEYQNCIVYNSEVPFYKEEQNIVEYFFACKNFESNLNGEYLFSYSKGGKSNFPLCIENTQLLKSDRFIRAGEGFKYTNINSRKVYTLDSIYRYTSVLEYPIYDLNIDHPEYNFEIEFKNTNEKNACHLVAIHKRGNRNLEVQYFPLHQYSDSTNTVNKAFFSFSPSNTLEKKDNVQFFIWNQGNENVYIYKLRGEIFKR
jgi:hypothetical protein